MFSRLFYALSSLIVVLLVSMSSVHSETVKIGISTALTGDAASFGIDIKNAILFMNEKIGAGRYELVLEDERCDNSSALSVAKKLINVDRVKYVLGFPCNSSLLATAKIYDQAGAVVITSAATSGDRLNIGQSIFRLFPSDVDAANLLYLYLSKLHKRVAILSEQNEFPLLMERAFLAKNKANKDLLAINLAEFTHGETDLRTVILKMVATRAEAIFVNANTDSSFISVIKQIRALNYNGAIYGAYMPSSALVLKELGRAANGIIFVNMPSTQELLTKKGAQLYQEFIERFGEPQSGFAVVPTSFEALRVLDLAIRSEADPVQFLKETKFTSGYIPNYYFDSNGAVQGVDFQIQKIVDGKIEILK